MQKDFVRAIVFAALAFVLLEINKLIQMYTPEYQTAFIALGIGAAISYIFKIYEN